MTKRTYLLDNKIIESSKCYGFIHIARKNYKCVSCGKPIEKGSKYVRFNYPFMGDEFLHFDCAISDWSTDNKEGSVILATKVENRKRWGLVRPYVICEKFYLTSPTTETE